MIVLFEVLFILLFVLALIHGIRRYSAKRVLLAFTIIAVMVAVEENASMLLTRDYAYYGYYLWIGEFPVCIMLGWIAVAYLGFLIASRVNNVVIGAAAAASVDLILEPVAYFFGLWVWHNTVSVPLYFGSPIQNAAGWFFLTWIGVLILKKLVTVKAT